MHVVMVVDDDDVALRVMSKTLESAGIQTLPFTDPVEALDTLNHRAIHVVLTDLVMDGLDGVTLFSKARRQQPMLRGICTSAFIDYASMTRIVEAGFDDCLAKPVRKMAIMESVLFSLARYDLWRNRLAALRGIEIDA